MLISIIDLGTNTCNLLIADTEKEFPGIIYRTKEPVMLGKGGIVDGKLTPEAFTRGIQVIKKYKSIITDNKVDKTFAFATSAMRGAINSTEFIEETIHKTGINIEIISGDLEAELVYSGVKEAVKLTKEKVLILDIGGGSNEFIICNKNQMFWKQSFKTGIARVMDTFHPKDPLSETDIKNINNYFEENLIQLFEAYKKHRPTTLIGSSGSFDTFSKMVNPDTYEKNLYKNKTATIISVEMFYELHNMLIKSSLLERKKMKGLDPIRVDMIHVASLLVDFIIRKLNITTLIQSDFSLKEGALIKIIR